MQPDVSVIMPVYNSKQYLACAIESVLSQTHKNFELILVDDGSTDGCDAVCDAYMQKDRRVRVIHKSNGGISSARNAGVSAARGEYLAYCDNDDKYLPNLLRDNYALAKKSGADILRFKRLKITYKENGRVIKTMDGLNRYAVLRGDQISKDYFTLLTGYLTVWNALYRSSMVKENGIRFPECMKSGGEDIYFSCSCYEKADCIVLNPKVYYYWIQREKHSTTGRFDNNSISSMIANMKKEWKLLEKRNVEKYQEDCFYLRTSDWLHKAFAYMNQKKCPYSIWQKAGILRLICRQIPDAEKIRMSDRDKSIRHAIRHHNGFYLYYAFSQLGLEW